MHNVFNRVVLFGRQGGDDIIETLLAVRDYLCEQYVEVFFEQETAANLPPQPQPSITRKELAERCDLVIVVGGDGSLLRAAHVAAEQNLPVLGVNRGRLGFLTDIYPEEVARIGRVLEGDYQEEKRTLIGARLEGEQLITEGVALNDVVLSPGNVPRMIEFDIYINQQFVCRQRADGLIIATPTGSTAYSLSGGGPILHPSLNAMVLVPMFPHTLSSRPIVVSGDSIIEVRISRGNPSSPEVSYDGQERVAIPPNGKITVTQQPERLRLIHPKDYNYFETLRTKLRWEN
ncbi:MAG: NAD(+) kinase [Gammaproteobacteria bacterium]